MSDNNTNDIVNDYSEEFPELSNSVENTINEINHFDGKKQKQIEAPEDREKLPDILSVPEIDTPKK